MKKLSIKQKNFHTKISQILWEDWDPVGVNDGNNTWTDEYDSYVPDIFQKVVDGRMLTRLRIYYQVVPSKVWELRLIRVAT